MADNKELLPDQQRAIGHTVAYYEVLSRELDGEGSCVGVDLDIRIKDVSQFALNVITKGHYKNENVAEAFEDREYPEHLLIQEEPPLQLPPFVVNDTEITDEVLEKKFANRVIEADLAASLWPVTE